MAAQQRMRRATNQQTNTDWVIHMGLLFGGPVCGFTATAAFTENQTVDDAAGGSKRLLPVQFGVLLLVKIKIW